jgi:hypothetical protein
MRQCVQSGNCGDVGVFHSVSPFPVVASAFVSRLEYWDNLSERLQLEIHA